MTKPLPRWARHRCTHPNRVELTVSFRIVRDYCPDCGATWPTPAPTSDPTP